MRHFVQEAFFSRILYVLHSLVMFSEKRSQGKGTLTTDSSVQNVISIRLKYKTLIECSGLRCLRTIV